jgi:xanthine dehydrogenase accessory factor
MSASRLLEFFDKRCARAEALVLVTVVATRGSTYSKTGDQMLIDANGVACGMLSGGCLESDLVARAQVVLESGKTQTATYELAAGDDDVWGLGIGCDGAMTIYLQALTPGNAYAPFAAIANVLRGNVATQVSINDTDDDVALTFTVQPPRHILVLGAGLDAVPLANLIIGMGWRCTLADHRPAYVSNANFPDACHKHCAEPEQLATRLDLDVFDGVVVMSHHLASDREYLRQIAASAISYIGLLGPPARKGRLLSELGEQADALAGRIHGPAGLHLGGRGPELIALSIVAQIQQVLASD